MTNILGNVGIYLTSTILIMIVTSTIIQRIYSFENSKFGKLQKIFFQYQITDTIFLTSQYFALYLTFLFSLVFGFESILLYKTAYITLLCVNIFIIFKEMKTRNNFKIYIYNFMINLGISFMFISMYLNLSTPKYMFIFFPMLVILNIIMQVIINFLVAKKWS